MIDPPSATARVAARPGKAGACDREPDSQLARRGQAGDGAALAAIYRRYAPLATATARRLLRDSADVEDVVQETFLIVFEQLGQLADPMALRGWISRIAVSRAHRRFRSQHGVLHGDPQLVLEQQVSGDPSPEHVAELALLDRALQMPSGLRTPWMLRHVVGAALDDIAAVCSCSLATVKRRLAEAEAVIADYVNAFAGERPRRRRFARGTLAPHTLSGSPYTVSRTVNPKTPTDATVEIHDAVVPVTRTNLL